jgi:hypothetical protein
MGEMEWGKDKGKRIGERGYKGKEDGGKRTGE